MPLNPGDFPIDPNTTTGTDLADRLNRLATSVPLYNATSQLGINVLSPTYQLDVAAANPSQGIVAQFQNTGVAPNTGTQITFLQSGVGWWTIGQPGTQDAFCIWQGRNNLSAGAETFRITNSHNVCIGVQGDIGTAKFSVGTTGLFPFGARNDNAGVGRYWNFGPSSSNSFILQTHAAQGLYVLEGGTSWTAISDERKKTDLSPIDDALSKVSSLRAVTGRYKDDEAGKSRSFLIAQDVQRVLPEAVHEQDDADRTLGLSYTEVIPLLVAAIKELKDELDAAKARIAKLEARP